MSNTRQTAYKRSNRNHMYTKNANEKHVLQEKFAGESMPAKDYDT